jgi:molybdate transport system substrate-binding protein
MNPAYPMRVTPRPASAAASGQWCRGVVAWLLVVCSVVSARAEPLTVSAAASLSEAFREIATRFEAARPGVTVRLNLGASGILLQQIAQGAPVDVFASADQETLQRAQDQKLIDADTRRNFAANVLVLVEPAAGGARLQSLQDLARPAVRRIAVGKPATVPAGRYSRSVLEAAGLLAGVESRLVPADSVRQVLDYVARGEVEAGFVYRTDAATMPERVRVVQTLGGHAPITYPAAVVSDSRHKPLAREFVQFLQGDVAQKILTRHGFARP